MKLRLMVIAILMCVVFTFGASASAVETVYLYHEKNPGAAALFSFLINGGGQIYNGEIGKGLLIMGGQAALATVSVVSASNTNYGEPNTIGAIAGAGMVGLAIWSMYDAYTTAERINEKARQRHIKAFIDDKNVGLQVAFEF